MSIVRALLGRLAAKWKSMRRVAAPSSPAPATARSSPDKEFDRFLLVTKEHSSFSTRELHGIAYLPAAMTFMKVLHSFVTHSDRAQAQVSQAMDVCESERISMQDAFERLGIEYDESLLATITM